MFVDITDRVLMEQEQVRLHAQNAYLWEEIRSEHNFGDIVGKTPAILKVMQQIQLVAPTCAAVLISGESGTGKELVARAIQKCSQRKGNALIKVNCSAVPEHLRSRCNRFSSVDARRTETPRAREHNCRADASRRQALWIARCSGIAGHEAHDACFAHQSSRDQAERVGP